jgi:hypothetical protein
VRPGERRPSSTSSRGIRIAFAVPDRSPLFAGMELQIERPELVHAKHHCRVARAGRGLAVGDVVELEHPVLLGFEVGIVTHFEGLDGLKRDAFLAEQDPQALVADVVEHPLSHQKLRQLRQRPRRERQIMIHRSRQRDLLDLTSLRQRERRWPATRVLRCQRVEPIRVEVVDHFPGPVLGRERDPRDRRNVHPLRRPQHDLRPPPPHDRPRTAPHDRQQLAALVVRQIPHLHPFSHTNESARTRPPSGGRDPSDVAGHGTGNHVREPAPSVAIKAAPPRLMTSHGRVRLPARSPRATRS